MCVCACAPVRAACMSSVCGGQKRALASRSSGIKSFSGVRDQIQDFINTILVFSTKQHPLPPNPKQRLHAVCVLHGFNFGDG